MSNILEERIAYKPFEYQWAFDYWFAQHSAHWMHHQIQMQGDIKDWNENLDEKEKNVISNILKGFAQTELEVEDYWSTYVTKWFPKPEIRKMAIAFADSETIHAEAYSYLNETLGLNDFEAFLKDPTTMAKLETLMAVDKDDESIENIARSLALFSACAEGIQLFSSFAVMLSFRPTNRMKGISQQMVYSIRDESMHSAAGCKLFRTLIEENPHIATEEFIASVNEGINLALANEFDYIDKIFEMGDLDTITKAQLKNFMYDRANRKAAELGLPNPTLHAVDPVLLEEMSWFYTIISAPVNGDDFDLHTSNYSEANADWNGEDLF
jgi:ribonucleoside-diphosphate reductase beta chain